MTEEWKNEDDAWYQELKRLYAEMGNRKFSYDPGADALYQNAKAQLTREGSRAMQDTMAQAAGLTGGYGSSYAQTAGRKAYESRLDRLASLLPTLYEKAARRFDAGTDELYDRIGVVTGLYDQDYQAYLDRTDRAQKQENWQAEYDQKEAQWREKLAAQIHQWEQNQSATQDRNDRSYAYRMAMLALQHGLEVSDALLEAAGIDRDYADAIRSYFAAP